MKKLITHTDKPVIYIKIYLGRHAHTITLIHTHTQLQT